MLSLSLIRLSDGRPAGLAWYDVESWSDGLGEALDELGVSLGPLGRSLLSHATEVRGALSYDEARRAWMRQAALLLESWGLTLTPLTDDLRAAYDETDPGIF